MLSTSKKTPVKEIHIRYKRSELQFKLALYEFRPINILPSVEKILEIAVYNQIVANVGVGEYLLVLNNLDFFK